MGFAVQIPKINDDPVVESAEVRTPLTVAENIQRGTEAMKRVISRHVNEPRAMFRNDLGWIALNWGRPGKGPPHFLGGHGVSHIIARRDWEGKQRGPYHGQKGEDVCFKMVSVIARGQKKKSYGPEPARRVDVSHHGYTAVLSMRYHNKEKIWLLTGWKDEPSGEAGEMYDSPDPTHNGPTRFRPNEGAESKSFNEIIQPSSNSVKKPIFEKGGPRQTWAADIASAKTYHDIADVFIKVFGDEIMPDPIVDVRTRLEKKYADLLSTYSPVDITLPEPAATVLTDLMENDLEPEALEAFLRDQKYDPDMVGLVRDVLAEKFGDLIETYVYDGHAEGLALESYIDSMLRVTEKGAGVYESSGGGGGPWIGVDLDGTLAMDDGKFDMRKIGDPVPAMLEKVKAMVKAGRKVKIFTARAANRGSVPIIQEWCIKHGLGRLPVTNRKDRYMKKLIDDRAIPIKKNEGSIDRSVTVARIFESAGIDPKTKIKNASSFEEIAKVFEEIFKVTPVAVTHRAEDEENLKKLAAGDFNDLEPEPFLKVLARVYRTTGDIQTCRQAAIDYVAANLNKYGKAN